MIRPPIHIPLRPLARPRRPSVRPLRGAGRLPAAALAAALLLGLGFPAASPAGEGRGEEGFPAAVEVVVEGEPRVLELTGRTMREKFFIDVYRMAHYMESPPAGTLDEVTAAVLADGRAKRIVMRFVRDVPREKILESLREGLRINSTPEEYRAMAAPVELFCDCISRSARNGDVFELLWLPGGAVSARFDGVEVFAARDRIFARTLWSIWFGERSVVEPAELTSRLVVGD